MRASSRHHQADVQGIDLLPPASARRKQRVRQPLRDAQEIVDADFIVLGKASPADPPAPTKAAPEVNASDAARPSLRFHLDGLELRLQQLPQRQFVTLVCAAVLMVFLAVVVPLVRATDHPDIIARPLDFVHVNLTPQDRNGMRVLLVSAIVENRSSRRLVIPRVRADLVVDGQVVASTFIAPPGGDIAAGRSRGLSAHLQHPGGKTPDLRLSFDDTGV